ncbi:MAG: 50S ribosomal protein L22 [Candidatus Melainabacteria bacterium]|jgi:large subunit ribosomal protein L22|nr:50S ribosomal protein L22 [Candidatus Melainabacteria bacterium]
MAKKDDDKKVEETAEKKPAKKKAAAKKTETADKKPAKATKAKTETKATKEAKVEEAPKAETKPATKVVRARIGFMRQTARKVRRCVNLIRTMTAGDAVKQLGFAPYAAALPIKKLIESAMANASHNFSIENPENLKISQLLVDDGVVYKRWRAVSKGTAHSIKKRTAQVRLVLSEMNAAEYAAYVWDNSPRNKKKGKVA